nr:PREDICTED: mimitin, mitochondrial [Bemisia tabaci]
MGERRIWYNVWKSFIDSLMPRRFTGDHVGTDSFGNKYYEIPKTSTNRQRPQRYFVTAKKEDFEAPMPAEWESWLRNRRKFPPTPEEIAENVRIMEQKKKGAAEIAEKFKLSAPNPEKDPLSFPTYGDQYDINPGSFERGDKKNKS